MSRLPTFRKDPDSQLDFGFDWSGWLETGDSITDSSWEVDSADVTIVGDEFTDTKTKVWLSGGAAGTSYRVTNRVTTAGGAFSRIVDRSFLLRVLER